jgi:branched-chain amino acid transport system ATP-binding protein
VTVGTPADRHHAAVQGPEGVEDVVLRTTGLTWRVGGFTIVEDVSLTVRRGEFVSVIGPNGAGKSTLINLLSGVARPVAGRIELDGVDVTRTRPSDRVRRGLGRTFQTSSLFPGLSVLENARLAAAGRSGSLALWRRPSSGTAAERRARTTLDEVGLGHRADDRVAELAHGDKRKLEIAVVLCGDPAVLLLDEPTAGVSAEEVGPLVEVVRQVHARGRTVVMVEHHMELVTGMSDRIAVMHQGRLLLADVPTVVMADPTVREAYLGGDL